MSAIAESPKRREIVALLAGGLALCSMPAAATASREELDAHVREALDDLYRNHQAARELGARSAGILVFPNVVKAGFWVGAEYGKGALLTGKSIADYYFLVAASFGLQFGVQDESVALMFMTPEALSKFRASDGWVAGVDGSVAVATLGAGGSADTETLKKPIVGFIFNNKGLMANLALQGTKISRLEHP